MKKALKIFLVLLFALFIIISGFFAYCFIITSGVKIDENKLVNLDNRAVYYDNTGNVITEDYKGISVAEIRKMPSYVKNAFIAIEDKRFYSHNGVDYRSMARAAIANISSFSFKEGASTISQQLIKNTHLSGEKTLNRKIIEIKLAKELEKKYEKDEILEKYLNTIYFGSNSYGISEAADNYFGKTPEELTLSEAATLAGLIKAPSSYSPFSDTGKCLKRRNTVLKEMLNQGFIEESEYINAESSALNITYRGKIFDYSYLAKKEADIILGDKVKNNRGYKIYTNYDINLQKILDNTVEKDEGYNDFSAVITDNKSKVLAYRSTIGEEKRQIGSTIKPVLVYAPAIEYDVISPLSVILDEKTDFDGYSPDNYNDKYYGYVSASFALEKSLNVCSVKLLNEVGVSKCKNFANKTGIKIEDDDNSLKIALGSTEEGIKLTDLTASYNIFSANGYYNQPHCISKITDAGGKIIYLNDNKEEKVCSAETSYLINSMLYETAKSGTAKNLYDKSFPVCAKTGTVGNEIGNTDALTVSYTPEFTVGVWLGNADGAYMDNSITGGSVPALISAKIWSEVNGVYKTSVFSKPDGVSEVFLDKVSYEKDKKMLLSSENTPERFKIKGLFKNKNIPKEVSDRFNIPTVLKKKISVNNDGILIELCLTELVEAKIYRTFDGVKTLVYDTMGKEKKFLDNCVSSGNRYVYSIVPYYSYDGGTLIGKEVFFEEVRFGCENEDDWWIDFDL